MRFHLIDRVDAYEPARSVRARKLTSRSEEYWEESPRGPIMPPPFVLEALCQAGTWLVMITTDRSKRAALLSIGSVDFVGDVYPGIMGNIRVLTYRYRGSAGTGGSSTTASGGGGKK